MNETLGEYIHNLRKEANMTVTKLAAALDLDQSTLSKIENRKRSVPQEVLPKLAEIFNLDNKELEREYFSEKIAEIIYREEDTTVLLRLAEKKAKHFKSKKIEQGTINYNK